MTQRDRTLAALRNAGDTGVTNRVLNDTVGFRYGARIMELRDAGYVIESERLGRSFWLYRLISEPPPKFCECGCGAVPPAGSRYINTHHARTLPDPPYEVQQETGCWLWLGSKDTAGYGSVRSEGRTTRAYRVLYEKTHGPVPTGLELDHLCRNRACVNPDHLEAVTHAENIQRSPLATPLNWDDVAYIRMSTRPASEIAAELGINKNTVTRIRRGESWAYEGNDPPEPTVPSRRDAPVPLLGETTDARDGVSSASRPEGTGGTRLFDLEPTEERRSAITGKPLEGREEAA